MLALIVWSHPLEFNYNIATLKTKAYRNKNDRLDAVLDIDMKFTTPHEVKNMTASVVFTLFLFARVGRA